MLYSDGTSMWRSGSVVKRTLVTKVVQEKFNVGTR
jgi:hypothetical protein